jgi:hypothetical protein
VCLTSTGLLMEGLDSIGLGRTHHGLDTFCEFDT